MTFSPTAYDAGFQKWELMMNMLSNSARLTVCAALLMLSSQCWAAQQDPPAEAAAAEKSDAGKKDEADKEVSQKITEEAKQANSGSKALAQIGMASAVSSTLAQLTLLQAHGPLFRSAYKDKKFFKRNGFDLGLRASTAVDIQSQAFSDYARQQLLLGEGGLLNVSLSLRMLEVVQVRIKSKELDAGTADREGQCGPITDEVRVVSFDEKGELKKRPCEYITKIFDTEGGFVQNKRLYNVDRFYLPAYAGSKRWHFGAYTGQESNQIWFYLPMGLRAQGLKRAQNSDGLGLAGMGSAYFGIGFDGPLQAMTGSDFGIKPGSGWIDVQAHIAGKLVNKSTLRSMFGEEGASQFLTGGLKASFEMTDAITLGIEYESVIGGANRRLLKDTALLSFNVATGKN